MTTQCHPGLRQISRVLATLAVLISSPATLPAQSGQPTKPTLVCDGVTQEVIANQTYQCQIQWPNGPANVTPSADPPGSGSLPGTVELTKGTSDFFPVVFLAPTADKRYQRVTIEASDSDKTMLATFTVSPSGHYTGGEIFRLVGGGEEAFAPNLKPVGKLFADMFLEWGIFGSDKPKKYSPYGSPWRFWLQAGARSTTQAATGQKALSLLTGSIPNGLNSGSVEAFALRSGISRRLSHTRNNFLNGIPHGTSDTLVYLIAGAGFTTPVNSSSQPAGAYPKVYVCDTGNTVCAQGQNAGRGDYLVVNPPVRTSFFSNWGAGLRFETFYDESDDSHQPALTDVTLGRDQAVTGGEFGRPVFHFEGFWPLPGGADFIFLIFGGSVRFPGDNIGFQNPTLFYSNLTPANIAAPYAGANFIQKNDILYPADNFRVGIAVNVVDFLKNHLKH